MALRDFPSLDFVPDDLEIFQVNMGKIDGDATVALPSNDASETRDDEIDHGRAGTSTKKQGQAGASSKRHRPYQPRTGSARERNLQAQRRYRERLKERAAAAQAELATTAVELEEARAAQDALRAENNALELLRRYTDGVILAMRSTVAAAAESLTSSASSVFSIHADIMDYLWSKVLRPSDSQLRFLARHIDRLPNSFLCNSFAGRLVAAVEQWHCSPPSGREAVEKKLSQVFETRARLAAMVLTEFPEKESHFIRIHQYCGELHALIDEATCLSAPDVLQAVALTDDQTAALNSHWDAYVGRYRGGKGLVTAATAQIHLATETFMDEADSLRGVVRRNADAQRGAAAAAAFLADERAARVDLFSATIRTLHPIQCAWLQLMAMRMLAGPDIVGAITHILPHMARSPVPAPAALMAMVGSEVVDTGAGTPPRQPKQELYYAH